MVDDTIMNEYEKVLHFLKVSCSCDCSAKMLKKEFAELREAFQALSKTGQDIFLMAQLKAINSGEITASRHLKNKPHTNKRTFYYWDRNTPLCQKTYLNILGVGCTHFDNVRNHLATNGIIPRIHGNIKRVPR